MLCRCQTEEADPGRHAHLQKCPPSERGLKLHKTRDLTVEGEGEGVEGKEVESKVDGAKEEEEARKERAEVATKEEVGGVSRQVMMVPIRVTKATKVIKNITHRRHVIEPTLCVCVCVQYHNVR